MTCVQRLVVEGVGERLAHPHVVDRGRAGVDVDRVDAARRLRRATRRRRPRRAASVSARIDWAAWISPFAHARLAHVVVEDHAERDLVEVRLALLPVVRVLDDDRAVAGRPAPRACTGRVPTGVSFSVPAAMRRRAGDQPEVAGEHLGEGDPRELQLDLDGQRVDDRHRLDVRRRWPSARDRLVRVHVPLEVDLHGLGVERRAVLEHHAVVQGDRVGLVVVGLDRLGEVRLGHALGREPHQRVVERACRCGRR